MEHSYARVLRGVRGAQTPVLVGDLGAAGTPRKVCQCVHCLNRSVALIGGCGYLNFNARKSLDVVVRFLKKIRSTNLKQSCMHARVLILCRGLSSVFVSVTWQPAALSKHYMKYHQRGNSQKPQILRSWTCDMLLHSPTQRSPNNCKLVQILGVWSHGLHLPDGHDHAMGE